ncbi:MAG TPA: hypothetical protein VNO23_04380 [Candidatus Binatia bacterium]|nr:hypothetical protein [Candidatus Binatia bacterium]
MAPPDQTPEMRGQPTRLTCPDCSGVLSLRVEGFKGYLTFACRVGHRYSVAELLIAKEEQLEYRLWSAVLALDEMNELLGDLAEKATGQGLSATAAQMQDRATQAAAAGQTIRGLIAANRAVQVGEEIHRLRAAGP